MPRKNHHDKPFDEGTLTKLEIFESYVEAWLPVFIVQPQVKEVNIVDFFAGPGYDINGVKGSPIRILEKILLFINILKRNKTNINLFLNEYEDDKFDKLQKNCDNYLLSNNDLNRFVNVYYSKKDFNDSYYEMIEKTRNTPNLFILDQSGVRFTCQENFNTLLELNRTDFLFFISSSYFNRFSQNNENEKHLKISRNDIQGNPYNFIHRTVLEKYRSLIPENSDLKIFPFSIKKSANIYGIIFGSKHIRGVEKFLKIAWSKNRINGEADYDIAA